MQNRPRIGFAVLCLAVLSLSGVRAADPPAADAAKVYRLVAPTVDGTQPPQRVLVIITPEGYAWVTTPEALHGSVERRVPGGATLQWVPQDTARDGDPLRTEQQLDALRKLCAARKIKFVHIPAG